MGHQPCPHTLRAGCHWVEISCVLGRGQEAASWPFCCPALSVLAPDIRERPELVRLCTLDSSIPTGPRLPPFPRADPSLPPFLGLLVTSSPVIDITLCFLSEACPAVPPLSSAHPSVSLWTFLDRLLCRKTSLPRPAPFLLASLSQPVHMLQCCPGRVSPGSLSAFSSTRHFLHLMCLRTTQA